jgi:tetratricopeptide (TPR) repeat protein
MRIRLSEFRLLVLTLAVFSATAAQEKVAWVWRIDPGSTVALKRSGTGDWRNAWTPEVCQPGGEICALREGDSLRISKAALLQIKTSPGLCELSAGEVTRISSHEFDRMCKWQSRGIPVGGQVPHYIPGSPDAFYELMLEGKLLGESQHYDEARQRYRLAQQTMPGSTLIQTMIDRLDWAEELKKEQRAPRTFAVVIGVSEFQWLSKEWQLESAARDAASFSGYLASPKGGSLSNPRDITRITAKQATTAAIRRALRGVLLTKARSGDTVIIYLAGHAIEQWKQAFLVGYDSRLEEPQTWYPLDELRQMVEDAARLQIYTRLFADVCHAGALQRLTRRSRSILPASLGRNYFAGNAGHYVWGIAASRAGEFSLDTDHHKHGAFTWSLIEALNDPGEMSNDKLLRRVQEDVTKLNGIQYPVEIGSGGEGPPVWKKGVPMPPAELQDPPAPRNPRRYNRNGPAREWALHKDATGEAADRARETLSLDLEDAGDALLNEYLGGHEIPQEAEDFAVGMEIYKTLRLMADSGRVAQDRQLIEVRRLFFEAMWELRKAQSPDSRNAIVLLKQALAESPEAGYLYNALGQAYAFQATEGEGGRNLRDQTCPRKGLSKDPLCLAIDAFRDATLLSPDWAYPRHNLAILSEAMALDRQAEGLYREAIDRASQSGTPAASTHYNYGRLLHVSNDYSAARKQYTEGRKAFAKLSASYEELAKGCQGGDCEAYQRIIRGLHVGEAQAWNALGILEHDDHHHDDAAVKDYGCAISVLRDTGDEGTPVRNNVDFNLRSLQKILGGNSGLGKGRISELLSGAAQCTQ